VFNYTWHFGGGLVLETQLTVVYGIVAECALGDRGISYQGF